MGNRSINALATVRPPKPLSNIPMGRSSISAASLGDGPYSPGTRAQPGLAQK